MYLLQTEAIEIIILFYLWPTIYVHKSSSLGSFKYNYTNRISLHNSSYHFVSYCSHKNNNCIGSNIHDFRMTTFLQSTLKLKIEQYRFIVLEQIASEKTFSV